MRYVINSSDINDTYSFFIPIIGLLWRERGYNPIILLVGDRGLWNSSKRNKCVLDFSEKIGLKVMFVKQILNYKSSTIAQVSRLFACADPFFKSDDYILTSDADMLPLSRTWFDQYDVNKTFNFFGGNAYLGYIGEASPSKLPQKFPICYIGSNVINWRQVMNIKELNLQISMEQLIKEREAAGCRDDWYYDELTFANKMFNSPLIAHSQFINRNWSGGRASQRLDRDNWNFSSQKNLIDCHFLRPGCNHLKTLCQVLIPEVYCYPGHLNLINEYTWTFMK